MKMVGPLKSVRAGVYCIFSTECSTFNNSSLYLFPKLSPKKGGVYEVN